MAKVVIGAEVKVDGLDKAGQSVGNFRKQLKEANNELLEMSQKFGDTSKQAQEAAKKVANLKGAIGDAKDLVETFNPDRKFVALGGALQGVVAGFSAFTGAMGLLGSQSKQVEELLLKVQSAMALQQGLSGLKGAIDSFKLLGNAIVASTAFQKANNIVTAIAATIQRAFGISVVGTSTAFNVLKAAIIATGIGALVVLIGVIVSKMDMFGKKTKTAAEEMDELAAATDRANKAVSEQVEILDRDSLLRIKRAKIAGVSEAELTKIQSEEIQKRIDLRNKEIDSAIGTGRSVTDLFKENLKDQQALQDLQLDYEIKAAETRRQVDAKAALERQAENDKRKKELTDLLAELGKLQSDSRAKEKAEIEAYGAELAAIDEAKADAERQRLRDNQEKMLETKAELAELALLEDPDSIDNKIAKINADLELELFALAEGDLRRQILAKQASDAIVKIKEDEVEAKKLIGQKELEYANTLAGGIANSLDTLAGIAGKQTAAGKALAIASTVIKTIQGGIAAFTGMTSSIPGPVGIALGVVAAAGVVAAGVKAVKQITAVKIPGASSGGASAPSISLPNAPITPQAQTTRLDQGSINAVGNAANRAYVLETDVSGNQERIRRLNRAARIN